MSEFNGTPLSAFCVDLEEWFHVCGVETRFSNPDAWADAPSHVVQDTEALMRLLDSAGARGTFLSVGWVARQHPDLIRRLVRAGHEIGCHGYWHRLVFSQSPDEFETDLARCLDILRDLSGQPVSVYRAPGFSMKRECFWAYPILRRHGIDVDVSIVPCRRDHGGIEGFVRDPFLLDTGEGAIRCFPVSVMSLAGRVVPFSGGGYLRLFPLWLIKAGFRQNFRAGRPAMSYIHPREINPDQPRLDLPVLKRIKYYINLASTERKLRALLQAFRFDTVSEVISHVTHWPRYELAGQDIRPVRDGSAAAVPPAPAPSRQPSWSRS